MDLSQIEPRLIEYGKEEGEAALKLQGEFVNHLFLNFEEFAQVVTNFGNFSSFDAKNGIIKMLNHYLSTNNPNGADPIALLDFITNIAFSDLVQNFNSFSDYAKSCITELQAHIIIHAYPEINSGFLQAIDENVPDAIKYKIIRDYTSMISSLDPSKLGLYHLINSYILQNDQKLLEIVGNGVFVKNVDAFYALSNISKTYFQYWVSDPNLVEAFGTAIQVAELNPPYILTLTSLMESPNVEIKPEIFTKFSVSDVINCINNSTEDINILLSAAKLLIACSRYVEVDDDAKLVQIQQALQFLKCPDNNVAYEVISFINHIIYEYPQFCDEIYLHIAERLVQYIENNPFPLVSSLYNNLLRSLSNCVRQNAEASTGVFLEVFTEENIGDSIPMKAAVMAIYSDLVRIVFRNMDNLGSFFSQLEPIFNQVLEYLDQVINEGQSIVPELFPLIYTFCYLTDALIIARMKSKPNAIEFLFDENQRITTFFAVLIRLVSLNQDENIRAKLLQLIYMLSSKAAKANIPVHFEPDTIYDLLRSTRNPEIVKACSLFQSFYDTETNGTLLESYINETNSVKTDENRGEISLLQAYYLLNLKPGSLGDKLGFFREFVVSQLNTYTENKVIFGKYIELLAHLFDQGFDIFMYWLNAIDVSPYIAQFTFCAVTYLRFINDSHSTNYQLSGDFISIQWVTDFAQKMLALFIQFMENIRKMKLSKSAYAEDLHMTVKYISSFIAYLPADLISDEQFGIILNIIKYLFANSYQTRPIIQVCLSFCKQLLKIDRRSLIVVEQLTPYTFSFIFSSKFDPNKEEYENFLIGATSFCSVWTAHRDFFIKATKAVESQITERNIFAEACFNFFTKFVCIEGEGDRGLTEAYLSTLAMNPDQAWPHVRRFYTNLISYRNFNSLPEGLPI